MLKKTRERKTNKPTFDYPVTIFNSGRNDVKKTLALTILLLLPLFFSTFSNASMTIQPLELTITMNDEFIHGNTLKTISVRNDNNFSVNVSWYVENPTPESWMRSNRTFIPNLSWIDVSPKWSVIEPGDTELFYIYLDVPESEENLDRHWETWVTFNQEPAGGLFNLEQAVRVLIDTPYFIVFDDQIDISIIFIIVFVLIMSIFVVVFLFFRYKKKQ